LEFEPRKKWRFHQEKWWVYHENDGLTRVEPIKLCFCNGRWWFN
jgi:hypothetical protein